MTNQIWEIKDNSIIWNVKSTDVHSDNIEMSGLRCDLIVYYGICEDGTLTLSQKCYFPSLRTIPNDTHATFCFSLEEKERPYFIQNGKAVAEHPVSFTFDGTLKIQSTTCDGITITRRIFPSADIPFAVELVSLCAHKPATLSLSLPGEYVHSYSKGTKGVYVSKIFHTAPDSISLTPDKEISFEIFYTSNTADKNISLPDGEGQLNLRRQRISELCDDSLVLKTDCRELDLMFRFAKLRAGESIFETLTGKYHSPGGHRYYAATWCNDQIEYAGPHFAMTGDKTAIEASLNAYRGYIPFMSDAFIRLPSSIIAEGLDIWEYAGDRGDAAMYLYGASLFCLYLGNPDVTKELYGAIKWCAEYCEKQKSPEGIICSDTDELEGRIPTDRYANLSTSSLCCGGLKYAAKLAASLGDIQTAKLYEERAGQLESAIDKYFGANLHGFETYRYSKGFDTLRAWICLPLCMDINMRQRGTIDALLSPYMWTEEGLLTCEISDELTCHTIWDRSTLYGIKGLFIAGAGDRIITPFLAYCRKRLLCDRVPYAVEAYPEGEKRHLSGESALFARVITEGMFGISPEGQHSFSFVPRLPRGINQMSLSKIFISGGCFDISIDKYGWTVIRNDEIVATGDTNGERVVICK